MPVVLYHIVDSAVRSRKPIRIIEMDKAPHGGGDSNDTKVSVTQKIAVTFTVDDGTMLQSRVYENMKWKYRPYRIL